LKLINCLDSGNSDHMPAIKALLRGSAKNLNQTYLIHLSGTGTIADTLSFPTGDLNPRIWSDIQDIKAIQSLPEGAMHRHVDKLLQEFAEQDGERENVNIAIMCPPDIYGTGTGTGYRYSYMVPFFVKTVLERGDSFYLGKGENTRSVVHVEDLARLYGKVVEDAVSGEKKVGWGKDVSWSAIYLKLVLTALH
jgi:nucleoside-diphosphate-sugar epimerase